MEDEDNEHLDPLIDVGWLVKSNVHVVGRSAIIVLPDGGLSDRCGAHQCRRPLCHMEVLSDEQERTVRARIPFAKRTERPNLQPATRRRPVPCLHRHGSLVQHSKLLLFTSLHHPPNPFYPPSFFLFFSLIPALLFVPPPTPLQAIPPPPLKRESYHARRGLIIPLYSLSSLSPQNHTLLKPPRWSLIKNSSCSARPFCLSRRQLAPKEFISCL